MGIDNGGTTIPDRLDAALVALGLVESRAKAQRLIKSGKVMVDGVTATKPAQTIASASDIAIDKGDDYVSRGAYKLVGAFDAFRAAGLPEPVGFDCLDIGASTGGFCDVLLRRGAHRVVALDVGHGQLDPRIADDPRIIEMSGVNIRDVRDGDLPYRPRMVVSDVSFISLTYVIPVIARIAAPDAHIVLLVKPQFEVGRGHLGKGGIVEDPALRERALAAVAACADECGLDVVATGAIADRGDARQRRVPAVRARGGALSGVQALRRLRCVCEQVGQNSDTSAVPSPATCEALHKRSIRQRSDSSTASACRVTHVRAWTRTALPTTVRARLDAVYSPIACRVSIMLCNGSMLSVSVRTSALSSTPCNVTDAAEMTLPLLRMPSTATSRAHTRSPSALTTPTNRSV